MASRRKTAGKKFRGAQKWIMAEINAIRPSESLSTAQITKRITKASGKDFHKNSVYLALRKLVERGAIKSVRIGQEKSYKISKSAGTSLANSASSEMTTSTSSVASSTPAAEMAGIPSDVMTPAGSLPHKLALGEILVLGYSDGQVLTATNLHGRLVMERHPVP
jgi:hypothetical protein